MAFRYRVIAGLHVELGPHGENMVIPAGQTFETDLDWLARRFPEKFESLGGSQNPNNPLDPNDPNRRQPNGIVPRQGESEEQFAKRCKEFWDTHNMKGGSLNDGTVESQQQMQKQVAANPPPRQGEPSSNDPLAVAASSPPPSHPLPPSSAQSGAFAGQLEKMSVKELQAHAEAEEIDLKGANKKEDIIRILRAAAK